MSKFPIVYDVSLVKRDGSTMDIASGPRPPIAASPPPEFGGTDARWSPEHLLVSAAASCLTATFLAGASHAKMNVEHLDCRAAGILDRAEGKVAFQSIRIDVRIRVAEADTERAQTIFAEAKPRCFVANSLNCPVEATCEVLAPGPVRSSAESPPMSGISPS